MGRTKVNYRKLWEEHHNKKIPDHHHIHHIDGNRDNNNIENLMCIHKEDHYRLHLKQGDIVARYGKFIQGASNAGKIGGMRGKGKPKYRSEKSLKSFRQNFRKTLDEKYDGSSPLKGRQISEEHRSNIKKWFDTHDNPMNGKNHSEATKKRLSEIGKTKVGELNSAYGYKHTEETKRIFSEKRKEAWKNGIYEECKKKTSETLKSANRRWYNNGIDIIFVKEGTQPDGYKLGRRRRDYRNS